MKGDFLELRTWIIVNSHESGVISGLSDEEIARGMTAITRSLSELFWFVMVRQARVPDGH